MTTTTQAISQFLRHELQKVRGPTKENKNWMNVVCPFHRDTDPSCGVRLDGSTRTVPLGNFHCFGCGKRGSWNEFADKLGLKKIKEGEKVIEENAHFDASSYKDMMTVGDAPGTWEDLLHDCYVRAAVRWNPGQSWREFDGKFLAALGAHEVIYTTKGTEQRRSRDMSALFFPVYIEEELVGGIRANLKKRKGQPSYINSPGEWSLTRGLWPYDYVEEMLDRTSLTFVVLVEGPRDAMRLLSLGIPALTTLGTKTFAVDKAKLVGMLPVEIVYVLGDGDEAGHAYNKLVKSVLKTQIETRAITIPISEERYDPCSLPPRMMLKLFKTLGIDPPKGYGKN